MTGSPRKALILTFARHGEHAEIQRALQHFQGMAGIDECFAIVTEASAPVLERLGVADRIVYGEGRSARSIIGKARSRHPKAAAVLYCDPEFRAHLKLEAVALLSGAPLIYRLAPETEIAVVSRLSLAWSVFAKVATVVAIAVASGTLCSVAYLCLRLSQAFSGGKRASRA